MKQYYKDEPLFKESKVVTSIYSQSFDETLNAGMVEKIQFDEIEETHIDKLKTPIYSNLMKVAVDFSDGIIKGSQELPKDLEDYIDYLRKTGIGLPIPRSFYRSLH